MLYDPEAEIEREIDVLVESEMLNCDIKIGIECTTTSRPVDVKIIESFFEKHRKVGIHQTVVVSKNGFTKAAKSYSVKKKIRLLTFDSAKSENWKKRFEALKDLTMYGRDYFLKSISLVFASEDGARSFELTADTFVLDNGEWVGVSKFAASLFMSAEVSKRAFNELISNEKNGSDPWVEVGFHLNEKYEFKDAAGRCVKPKQIVVRMGYRTKYENLLPRQVSYDGKDVVVGGFSGKKKGEYVHLAVSEIGGELRAMLEVGESFFPVGPDRNEHA